MTIELIERTFTFAGNDITLRCRHGPEHLEGRTLTLQIETDAKQPTTTIGGAATDDQIGLDVWPASIALSPNIPENTHLVKDRNVIELGAGTGLCGLAAAKLSARQECFVHRL